MTPQQIAELIFSSEGLPVEQLGNRTRKREYVTARQYCYYFLTEYTNIAQEKMALIFHKDRSTIPSAIKRLSGYMDVEKKTKEKIENYDKLIINRIKSENQ